MKKIIQITGSTNERICEKTILLHALTEDGKVYYRWEGKWHEYDVQ